ncbi:MAG: alpha/beta fold hydrolase [Prevotella sp.]|nr:alpha/beta fold hydrolase [Prevotella sp.]
MKRLVSLFILAIGAMTASAADITEEVVYAHRDSLDIYGLMYKPAGQTNLPIVICSHSSSLTHKAMKGYAQKIAQQGYAAYCFDFCGGSSESLSGGSTDSMTVFTEVEDLKSVVAMVKTLDYVDTTKIVLLGSSQGGLVSSLLAEDIPNEIASMVLFYPAYNIPELVNMFSGLGNGSSWGDGSWGGGSWGDGFGGMMSMSAAFVNSIKDFDVWSHIGTFPKPVCIVHGTSDFIVPISNSEKAVGLYPDAQLHPIEGANHGFNADNLGSMGSMMGSQADYDNQVMPIVYQFLSEHIAAGITNPKASNDNDDAIYELKGMRISSPRHGEIYIKGGKKIIQCSPRGL